jgi:hypothetical protein
MTVFTSPGTFTTPSTTTQIKVTVVGGGGSGQARAASPGNAGGGGGGGSAIYVGPVTASTPYAVTVGAGGTGVVQPSAGVTGGTSSFASLASATGGAGGPASPTASGGAGGAGSAGTLLFSGGFGDGGFAPIQGASGGSSFLGGMSRSAPGSTSYAGQPYGGGGSGIADNSVASGAGAAGVVVVEY